MNIFNNKFKLKIGFLTFILFQATTIIPAESKIHSNAPASIAISLILNSAPDFVMASDFFGAIQQKNIVMVSTPILQHPYADLPELQEPAEGWRVFLDTEGYFVLCIPGHEKRTLTQLGFNESFWEPVPLENIQTKLLSPLLSGKAIDAQWLAHFKQLWDVQNEIRKYFFLAGHGDIKIEIAGIPIDLFNNFLQFLDQIHTYFLWLTTCYAAGINLLEMQKSIKTDIKEPPFITVVESVGEIFVAGAFSALNLQRAGEKLDAFFDQPFPPFYLGIPLSFPPQKAARPQKIKIIDVIKALYGQHLPLITDLPDVYIPGAGFFRAIDVDNELIITEIALKKQRIASKISKRIAKGSTITNEFIAHALNTMQNAWSDLKKLKDVEKENKQLSPAQEKQRLELTHTYEDASRKLILAQNKMLAQKKSVSPAEKKESDKIKISVDPDTKYIVVYPQDLHDCTFSIQTDYSPIWLSKISGKSQHIIGKINAKKLSLLDLLHGFLPSSFFGASHFEASSGWFIKELQYALKKTPWTVKTINGLVIFHETGGDEQWQSPLAIALFSAIPNEYYMTVLPLPLIAQDIEWERIPKDLYLRIIMYLGNRSKARKDALFTASAGQENLKTQDAALDEFLKSLGTTQKIKRESKSDLIAEIIDKKITKHAATLWFNSLFNQVEIAEPSAALFLSNELSKRTVEMLQVPNIPFITDALKRALATAQMRAVNVILQTSLLYYSGQEFIQLGIDLLTGNLEYANAEIPLQFLKVFVNAGKIRIVHTIIEEIIKTHKNDALVQGHLKSTFPGIITALLQQEPYDAVKPLIKQLVDLGMPIDKLIAECASRYLLEAVAQQLATQYGKSDANKYAEYNKIISACRQNRGEIFQKDARKLSFEGIIDLILSPELSPELLPVLATAAHLRIEAHDTQKAAQIKPLLETALTYMWLNQLQRKALQAIIDQCIFSKS